MDDTNELFAIGRQQWDNVGTVVQGAASTGRKVEYNGQYYDFVFDVDIAEGQPPLKLPYNLSENPYERATRFIGDNELPMTYLDQVAKFIVQSTQGATISQGTSDGQGSSQPQPKLVLPQRKYVNLLQAKLPGKVSLPATARLT